MPLFHEGQYDTISPREYHYATILPGNIIMNFSPGRSVWHYFHREGQYDTIPEQGQCGREGKYGTISPSEGQYEKYSPKEG